MPPLLELMVTAVIRDLKLSITGVCSSALLELTNGVAQILDETLKMDWAKKDLSYGEQVCVGGGLSDEDIASAIMDPDCLSSPATKRINWQHAVLPLSTTARTTSQHKTPPNAAPLVHALPPSLDAHGHCWLNELGLRWAREPV